MLSAPDTTYSGTPAAT